MINKLRFLFLTRREKVLLEKAEEMAKFIECIPHWDDCGHEVRTCDCHSKISMELTLENMVDEAEELIYNWKK